MARIAARHHGAFTLEEAAAAGFSAAERARRVSIGRWVAERGGVYSIAGSPPTRERVLWCAAAAHPGSLVAGPTAAWLHGLPDADFDRVHLLTDIAGRARFEGVVGHRSRLIVPADRWTVRHIPVTAPARTIIDCSGHAALRRRLGPWIDHCLREGLLTMPVLAEAYLRMRPGPGRSLRLVRRHIERRGVEFQPGDSQPEVRIADVLEAAGLGRPQLGVAVSLPGRSTPLRPDGLYLPERVGFEYQSWRYHGAGQAEPFHADPRRMNLLRAHGYDIYPFTSESTEADIVETIGAALARRRREIGHRVTDIVAQ